MIKQRVVQLIEFKAIQKEWFYKKIGMTSANFRGSARNTPLNSTAIENILSEIPDVNPEWLLTGKGPMLKSQIPTESHPQVSPQPQAAPASILIEIIQEIKELAAKNERLKIENEQLKTQNKNLSENIRQLKAENEHLSKELDIKRPHNKLDKEEHTLQLETSKN